MEPKDLNTSNLSRRCISEPPLPANRSSSTFTQLTGLSTQSARDMIASSPNQKLNTTYLRGRNVVRSSTFPLLPSLNHTNKPQQMGRKPVNNIYQQEKFPSFKNQAINSREQILGPHQRGMIEGKKFQLRSRYIDLKEPTPPKRLEPASLRCNPLRKRCQEIGDCEGNQTDIKNVNQDGEDSDMLLSPCQPNLRRLSVITEKSAFSKTSKTLLFDLEEDNHVHRSTLPVVSGEKDFRRRRRADENNNFYDKNSKKLQEHLKITGKQFDPVETKAALLSNWFSTLRTG